MSWLSHQNPSLDPDKLEAEIEAELLQLKRENKIADPDPVLEKVFSSFSPPAADSSQLEIMAGYASGMEADFVFKRNRLLRPFLRLALKVLQKILKSQYIFNFLSIEVLRDQEDRIKKLEDRLAPEAGTRPR